MHERKRRLAVLFHESEILGAGVSVIRVLPELEARGWESHAWFPGPGPLVGASAAALRSHDYRARPLAVSARGWRRGPGLRRRVRATPAYLRAVRTWLLEVRPDVVHANSLVMLFEAMIARRLGLPIVLQVHELPLAGRKRDLTMRWATAVADVLVGVSRPVSEMLSEHAADTPVVTVHNGVPATSPAHEEPPAGFIVGSVGHVSRTKGTDIFLQAAELAVALRPELRFEHIGPSRLWGDEAFDRRVDELAAQPALRDSVAMLGRRRIEEGLARWRALVLPSRQDAFPLSSLEGMAAGIPVIAAAVGGIPEQIVHLESGILVPPEDPRAVSDWIVRLYDDPGLRERLAEGGRSRASTFTLAAQAAGLDRAYGSALARAKLRKRRARRGSAHVPF